MMYFLLIYDLVENYIEKRKTFRKAHFEHILASRARGEFFMGGAYNNQEQAALVFKVKSERTVEDFVQQDPYFIHGLITNYTIKQWNVVITADEILV